MIITIQAQDVNDLREKFVEMAKAFGLVLLTSSTQATATAHNEVPVVEAPQTGMAEASDEKPKAEKRTRKSKKTADLSVVPPAATEEEATDGEEETAPAPLITREDALQALKSVNGKKGLPVAKEILAKFGWARISDVKEEKYAEFIAACNEALA